VFDLPHVIAEARPTLKSYGLDDRMTAQVGDFFENVPGNADAYLLSRVLQIGTTPTPTVCSPPSGMPAFREVGSSLSNSSCRRATSPTCRR
jgi:O-methyltransferase domain